MSNKKYLICDCAGNTSLEILTNESHGSTCGPLKFRGKFQEAGVVNKNKRIYEYGILENERVRLQDVIKDRRLFGELDHPADSIIHLENASHVITNLWWEGQTLMGEGEILSTPAGQILETIIKSGIPVGISSRGVGSGKNNSEGIMVIDPSYKLITFDVVADPSTPKAFIGEHGKKESFYYTSNDSNKNFYTKNESSIINNNKPINPNILKGFLQGMFEESYSRLNGD